MTDDATFIPNLAPNHNPVTALLVYLIEKAKPADLRRYRVRDAYIRVGEKGGAQVAIFVQCGGDERGGKDAVLWNRIRQHPLFLSDEDSTIDGYATIFFRIPRAVVWTAERAALRVPLVGTSPEDKQKDAIDIQMGRPVPERTPRGLSDAHVKLTIMGLAASIECWNPADA